MKLRKILSFFTVLILICGIITTNVNAECYRTVTGNNYNVNYSDDYTKVTSITINFRYVDTADLAGENNSNRQYNLIFTKDATKKDTITTAFQGDVRIKDLASRLGITDAIYSDAAMVGQQGVTYARKTLSECNALAGTTVGDKEYCTLITGTYSTSDRAVLGKFEPNTTYYGLLVSGFSGGGSWYTDVAIELQVAENKSFIKLNENTRPVITVTDNHDPAQNGDVLTASSDADEVTYKWYYDDNNDGIPDDGTYLGTGDTHIVVPADSEHKIICVAEQNKDENGNDLHDASKPRQSSLPVDVHVEKGEVKVVEPATPNVNNTRIDVTSEEIKEKIELTDEEQNALDNGKNISIYLEVKDVTDSISENDKNKIQSSLSDDATIGMYLDANLVKKTDGEEPVRITELGGPIKVSFEIPEELLNSDPNIKRTYVIYILHDGEVTTANVTLDGNIASFETDKFLTYAIAYTDTVIETPATGDTKIDNPITVDNILTYVVLSIVSAGAIVGAGTYLKKNKGN